MKIYIKKTISSNYELLETPDQELGKGGQAYVYHIRTGGYEDYCLKKYIKLDDARRNFDRICYMIQHPPKNFMGSNSFRICWPTALAYDMQKNFIGYVMPLAFENSRDLKILEVYNAKPISQQSKYKNYPEWFDKYELDTNEGLKNRMKMLCNWSIALYSLHETRKYVIVDLKPENVMATSSGMISIVDTDSFQISENGKILFPGAAYTPAYFPPEGKETKDKNLPFSISCDCFASAVCFYKILTGVHPYGGTIKKSPYDGLENEAEFISAGLFAFGHKKQYLEFPAFNLHRHFENLSPTIQALFKRAFGPDPKGRPTMDEWGKALHEAALSNMNVILTTVKPLVANSLSLQILDVQFGDFDYDGNVLRKYGEKLYTDVSYLCPQIKYKSLRSNPAVEIFYRIYSPSGQLSYNSSSKPGFTASEKIACSANSVNTYTMLGWGNKNKTAYKEAGTWRFEFYEGDKCLYKSSVQIYSLAPQKPAYTPPPVTPPPTTPPPSTSPKPSSGGSGKGCLWILLLIGALWAGYQFWYKDYKLDKDALRTYVYANNLFLRSSTMADVEHNRIGTIPYGAELITYSMENGWAHVKVDGKKGYVASDYLLKAEEFRQLNGVWGNEDAKETVSTAKCRMAVSDYLKRNNLQTGNTGWQLFTKPKEMKPNSVLFPQLNNGYDYFTEFAFILKDNQSGKRKLAVYAFEENETPVFCYEEEAPEKGDLRSITYSKWNKRYKVSYANAPSGYKPQQQQQAQQRQQDRQEEAAAQSVASGKLSVLAVVFANVDYDNKVLTDFGQQLYSDMQYLKPKITYAKKTEATESFTLKVKIFRPDGTLVRGSTSPADCTFEQQVKVTGKDGTFWTMGWGNKNGTAYTAGTYRYEIWSNGTKLYTRMITVKDKSAAKSDTKTDLQSYQVYDAVDQMPEFPNGGTAGLIKYLSQHVKYPTIAQENGTQGLVKVTFIVNQDGSITDVKVLTGVDPYLDKEAVRVVKGMPKWKPGKKNGKVVRVKYTIPVSFRLN